MSVNKCPGQDKRFWKSDDIFEIPCESCGASMEFFRDDPRRRCAKCGILMLNPKIASGCAKWCAFAKECLGFDPNTGSSEESVADRLILAMKKTFGNDQRRISHALRVLNFADQILRAEKNASPVVVKAAAILHDIGILEAERKHGSSAGRYQEIEGPPIARKIMEELGMDAAVIEHVCKIVSQHHSARDIDTPEFRIVWDADWLVNLPDECPDPAKRQEIIEKVFKTPTGRRLASQLYLKEQTPAAPQQ